MLWALVSGAAHAEMEKTILPCEQKICFHWWPKLESVPGWHQDRELSLQYSYNAQAPDGFTFENAETVIYAKALFKPNFPDLTTLDMVIENDRKKFLASDPATVIKELPALKSRDGKPFKSYSFHSRAHKSWDRVSYSEEEKFYLIFTLSSGTEDGFEKAAGAYEQFIKQYKE